jgi:CheY-like chemotaxis protein
MQNQTPAKILVVDDSPTLLESLANALEMSDHSITSTTSGNKAIEIVKKQPKFDLIIVDYRMEDGDGLDVIKYVRGIGMDTPIILMTGLSTKKLVIELIHHQVFGFLEKPIDIRMLDELVSKAISATKQKEVENGLIEVGKNALNIIGFLQNPIQDLKKEFLELKKSISVRPPQEVEVMVSKIESSLNLLQNLSELPRKAPVNYQKVQLQEVMALIQAHCISYAVKKKVPLILPLNQIEFWGNKENIIQVLETLIMSSIDVVSNLENRWVRLQVEKGDNLIKITLTDSVDAAKLAPDKTLIYNVQKTLLKVQFFEAIHLVDGLESCFDKSQGKIQLEFSLSSFN